MKDSVPPMNRPWLKTLLKYLLGLLVLGYVLYANWRPKPGSPGPGLEEALSGPIHFGPLALAGLGIIVAVSLTFIRWYVLVRALDLPLAPREAARLGLLGYFFNTLLPGSVGGDLVKAAALVRSQDRRTAAVASIVFDRVIGLGGLAIVVVLSGGAFYLLGDPVLTAQPSLLAVLRGCLVIVAVASLGWLALGLLSTARAEALAAGLLRVPKVGRLLGELWRATWLYRQRPGAVAIAVALTVVGHGINVLVFDRAARVFAPDGATLPTLAEHFLLVPVGLAVKGFFPAPGGAGGGEFGFGKLYELVGAPASLGVLGSLAVLLLTWLLGTVAYFVAQFLHPPAVDDRLAPASRPGEPVPRPGGRG